MNIDNIIKWIAIAMIPLSIAIAFLLAYGGAFLSAIIWIGLAAIWYFNYRMICNTIKAKEELNVYFERLKNDSRN